MAEPQFIERSVVQVNGIDLDELINSVAESAETNLKDVNTMNKAQEVKGFKQGNVRYSLDIDAEPIIDARVPDWHGLMKSKTYFKISLRFNAGKPRSYFGCRVMSVVDSTTEGDSSQKLKIRALKRKG
jgi:hypothetical protein